VKNKKVKPHDSWVYVKFTRNFAMTKIDSEDNEIPFDIIGEFNNSEMNEAMMNILAGEYEESFEGSEFFITELKNGIRVLLVPHCDEETFSYELGESYRDKDFN